jgi:competence protein ComEA
MFPPSPSALRSRSALSPDEAWQRLAALHLRQPESHRPAAAQQPPDQQRDGPPEPMAQPWPADALTEREPAGPEPAGPEPAGPEPAGPEPAGPEPAGPEPPERGRPRLVRPSALARLRDRSAAALLDQIPPTVRSGRLQFDPRTAIALAALGLVAVALGLVLLMRAQPAGEPLPAVTSLAAADTPAPAGAASPAPSPTAPGATATTLVVHVAGKVGRPGVVTLPAGSRVIDALRAAGGVVGGVDTSALNLARMLVDGEQVAVGVAGAPAVAAGGVGGPSAPGSGSAEAANAAPVDLNSATFEQLQELPGVGPVLAQRIVEFRQQRGGFRAVDELRDVTGIGERRFADLRDRVRV